MALNIPLSDLVLLGLDIGVASGVISFFLASPYLSATEGRRRTAGWFLILVALLVGVQEAFLIGAAVLAGHVELLLACPLGAALGILYQRRRSRLRR